MRRNPHVAPCSSSSRSDASFWMSRGLQGWADGGILSLALDKANYSEQTAQVM